jgi:hypothetical protein
MTQEPRGSRKTVTACMYCIFSIEQARDRRFAHRAAPMQIFQVVSTGWTMGCNTGRALGLITCCNSGGPWRHPDRVEGVEWRPSSPEEGCCEAEGGGSEGSRETEHYTSYRRSIYT